jgi:hypothetical protein
MNASNIASYYTKEKFKIKVPNWSNQKIYKNIKKILTQHLYFCLKPNFKRIQIEASIISSGTDYEENKLIGKQTKILN